MQRTWPAILLFVALVTAVPMLDQRSHGAFERPESDLAFRLVDATAELGIDFTHRAAAIDAKVDHIAPHIMGVGAAVSAVDVDGDGWLDLYFANSAFGAPNALYRNRGDGTFEDVAAAAGIADLNRESTGVCMGSVWGDVDNDGDPDLFVYRYGETAFFVNRGDGTFADATESSGLGHWVNSNAACWFDYDRDGLLDLLVAGYFREEHDLWNLATSRIMHDSGQFAENGGRNLLFRNMGVGADGLPHFRDVTDSAGLDSTRWTFAVSAADLDGDGWQDLYVANDYNEEECLLNRPGGGSAGRRFEAADVGFDHHSKSGMSVAFGNLKNDGRLTVFVTNISAKGWILHGNNLRVSYMPETGRFLEEAEGALVDTGWAWGGQFGDLDNDGWQDIVVVNGFISAGERDYWYEAASLASASGEILSDAANWPPFDGRSQSGYERTRVLKNKAGRRFVEVGEQAGIADVLDGRAVVLCDLFDRGRLDVVVANQKGPALVYRNDPVPGAPEGSWIGFHLEGTTSNRDAYGASVRLTYGDAVQVQVSTSSSGFSAQSGPWLHFGLGEHAGPCSAEITWPSGLVQRLEDLESGRRHHLREPEATTPDGT